MTLHILLYCTVNHLILSSIITFIVIIIVCSMIHTWHAALSHIMKTIHTHLLTHCIWFLFLLSFSSLYTWKQRPKISVQLNLTQLNSHQHTRINSAQPWSSTKKFNTVFFPLVLFLILHYWSGFFVLGQQSGFYSFVGRPGWNPATNVTEGYLTFVGAGKINKVVQQGSAVVIRCKKH